MSSIETGDNRLRRRPARNARVSGELHQRPFGRVMRPYKPIEVLSADHQNKADVASAKAREWIDKDGLAMLVGGTSSGAAIAMAKVAAEKKRMGWPEQGVTRP